MGHSHTRATVRLAFLAAVIYNSWPLGYILNPGVARTGLSSALSASGQPFNWVFTGGDVVCGLLVLGAVWLLSRGPGMTARQAGIALTGLAVFGDMTAVSALLPLHCPSTIQTCGYQPGQPLGLHDVAGACAAFGLFIGLLLAWRLSMYIQRLARWDGILLLAWGMLGITFVLTPLPVVQHFPHIEQIAVVWQQIFLVLSGACLVFAVYSLETVARLDLPERKKSTSSEKLR